MRASVRALVCVRASVRSVRALPPPLRSAPPPHPPTPPPVRALQGWAPLPWAPSTRTHPPTHPPLPRSPSPPRARARLDYPGVGPEHSYLQDVGRAEYYAVTGAGYEGRGGGGRGGGGRGGGRDAQSTTL